MNGQLAAVRQGHGVLSGSLFGGPDRTDGAPGTWPPSGPLIFYGPPGFSYGT